MNEKTTDAATPTEGLHQPLPVHGYRPQDASTVDLVNYNKKLEEIILTRLDVLKDEEEA